MPDVWVYYVKFPEGLKEAVMPCLDGYTIYIDERLSDAERERVYAHALEHIRRGDCAGGDAGQIELEVHGEHCKG